MTAPDPDMVSCSSWGMWPASEDTDRREAFDRSEAVREGLRKWVVDRNPSAYAIYQRLVAARAFGDLK